MRRLSALILTSLLAASWAMAEDKPASAPTLPPDQVAGRMLKDAFGEKGLELLVKRGYLGTQEGGGMIRLQFAHWAALEDLQAAAPSVPDLAQAAQRILGDAPLASTGETLGFLPLARLPSSGLLTPGLHALIDAISEAHAVAALLPEKPLPEGANFFETPWGSALSSRFRGDLLEDPQPMVRPFFETFIAAPRPNDDAMAHLKAHLKAVYEKDASSLLEADARDGAASEDLRSWIRKYLADQRRAFSLKRTRDSLRKLDAKTGLSRDLADLETVAAVLREKPDLPASARRALEGSAATPPGKLTSVGIHLQAPERLGRHEMGDAVIITGGYWLDGLPVGQSIDIEETSYQDYGTAGIGGVESKTVSRKNGGPYLLRREIPLKDSRGFTFRWLAASFDSNALAEAVEVPVASDFESALDRLAAADRRRLACDSVGAGEAYAALEESLKEGAPVKKQYAELALTAKARRQAAAKDAADLSALEALVEKARQDSSPELCVYDTAQTDKAIRMSADLPAGCDKFLPELSGQLAHIRRRKSDQTTFAQRSAKGSSLFKDCKFASAAETWAQALAVLDADPAARCGATDKAADQLEADLAGARMASLWKERLEAEVTGAELEEIKDPSQNPAPEAALSIARRVVARIPTMEREGCYAREKTRALRLAASIGQSLPPPEAGTAIVRLPQDKGWRKTADEVLANLRQDQAAEAARDSRLEAEQRPTMSQAPAVAPPVEAEEAAAAPKPKKPAIKPKRPSAPARRKAAKASKPAPAAPAKAAPKEGGAQ